MTNPPTTRGIRAGIIGAGYIADWHADAIAATRGVTLAAVCDPSPSAAGAFSQARGCAAFGDLTEMLNAGVVDAVHVLTPPDLHGPVAQTCLEAGVHVLVEKPFALNGVEARTLADLAADKNKVLAAGHNFMGIPGYTRLKHQVTSGKLGRITSAQINWHFPMTPLRSGPFGLWFLREPRNLLLELGPHLFAFAADLFGTIEVVSLTLGKEIAIPGDTTRPQSWRIVARAGDVDITISLSLAETVDDRSVTLHGSGGRARLDYANDVLVSERDNTADLVVNPFLRQMSLAGQHLREGTVNAARQLVSLNRKSPYALSFRSMTQAFYGAISEGMPIDNRFSPQTATIVVDAIDATLKHLPKLAKPKRPTSKKTPKPSVLIVGGTGFIGRNLTRKLAAMGRDVRVVSRGRTGPFADISDHVETVSADLHDPASLRDAMQGIDTVVHLGKSLDASWEAALKNDVGTTMTIAHAALEVGVRRFVYTGTIASYDMSDPSVTITEGTGFADDMTDRNIYARSKAECEARLLALHREKGLPLVIARPGIVLGQGGPLQHWGIGRWHGAGAVRIWGNGRNTLPFVLNDDIAAGLIATMDHDGIDGESFNLVGDNLLTARDYFDAIHTRLGARITVKSGNLTQFWMADALKYLLKRYALGRTNALQASRRDWVSRAHLSPFDNAKARDLLGWTPVSDRAVFVDGAVSDADLFGF